ncbi:hypothetical protein OUY22_01445 [Nonomuraea sp. MCN248]|uniref:Uncharacterized protein n=1 Tax=Nonomuraea corallina TaxID=2989783 RepID=A0ABT4S4D7_9ACTN|nr:hypothetical protein [Nonomuraea corallina]MDA0632064.1 hypothetical protein [Nonomuraea corallina]
MIGGRMIMEAPLADIELMTLRKRIDLLEEQVRVLTAANLALVRSVENLRSAPVGPSGT